MRRMKWMLLMSLWVGGVWLTGSPEAAAQETGGTVAPSAPRTEATTAALPTSGGRDTGTVIQHELRAGDRLRFRIAEDPTTGKDPIVVAVNTVGEASFPVSRESDIRVTLGVRGKTLREVKELLTSRLLDEYYNRATVELNLEEKILTPGKVQFFGEMRGTFPISPDQPPMMLSEQMLQMGVPEFADLKRIKIHRVDPLTQATKIIEVDVRAIIRGGQRVKDVQLQDGDRVEVPQKWIN